VHCTYIPFQSGWQFFILTHTSLYNIYFCYIMPACDVEAHTDKPLPIVLFTTSLHFESKIGKSLSVRALIPKWGTVSQH